MHMVPVFAGLEPEQVEWVKQAALAPNSQNYRLYWNVLTETGSRRGIFHSDTLLQRVVIAGCCSEPELGGVVEV